MFWGLVLEPSKKYTQKVERSFHISQATLELKSAKDEAVSLILDFEGDSYILANLSKKNYHQVPLDLNFQAGNRVSFRTIGQGRVHLSGYHVPEDEFEGLLSNSEEDDEDEDEQMNVTEPLEENAGASVKRKKSVDKVNQKKKQKLDLTNEDEESDDGVVGKSKNLSESNITDMDDLSSDDSHLSQDSEEDDDEDDEDEAEEEEDDDEEDEEDSEEDESEEEVPIVKSPKSEKKKNDNGKLSNISMNGTPSKKDKKNKSKIESETPNKSHKEKTPNKSMKENETPKHDGKKGKSPDKNAKTPGGSSPNKKVLSGGVIVDEIRQGEGPVAKPGKMVSVYYAGKIQSNNRIFDSVVVGPGLKFRLGKGEVIKGWDIGVTGMKVGGKRVLTIPPAMAYGQKGSPPVIPPNATLIFEVELRSMS